MDSAVWLHKNICFRGKKRVTCCIQTRRNITSYSCNYILPQEISPLRWCTRSAPPPESTGSSSSGAAGAMCPLSFCVIACGSTAFSLVFHSLPRDMLSFLGQAVENNTPPVECQGVSVACLPCSREKNCSTGYLKM
jgi:hypothetical protein